MKPEISRRGFLILAATAPVAALTGYAIVSSRQKDQHPLLDFARGRIQKLVSEAVMPTIDYKSTMGIYGGRLAQDLDGKLVLDRRSWITRFIDIPGDWVLRNYDEHTVNLTKFFRKDRYHWHPDWFLKFFMPGPKRHRGNNEAVLANIQRLNLQDYYGPHPWGIEIKNPDLFTMGVPYQDILRADLIGVDKVTQIDRFQATAEAARYMRSIHDQSGGIGEGVPYRFIFQKVEGNKAWDPILFIPDIVYNPDKYDPKKMTTKAAGLDQKATDYLEFLLSVGFEEYRRSADWSLVDRVLDIATASYADPLVTKVTHSFARRGRITLNEPLFSQHNRVHIGFDPHYASAIRQRAIEACERFRRAT